MRRTMIVAPLVSRDLILALPAILKFVDMFPGTEVMLPNNAVSYHFVEEDFFLLDVPREMDNWYEFPVEIPECDSYEQVVLQAPDSDNAAADFYCQLGIPSGYDSYELWKPSFWKFGKGYEHYFESMLNRDYESALVKGGPIVMFDFPPEFKSYMPRELGFSIETMTRLSGLNPVFLDYDRYERKPLEGQNYVGVEPILLFSSYLVGSSVVVGRDGFLTHLSTSLGIPTISIFDDKTPPRGYTYGVDHYDWVEVSTGNYLDARELREKIFDKAGLTGSGGN